MADVIVRIAKHARTRQKLKVTFLSGHAVERCEVGQGGVLSTKHYFFEQDLCIYILNRDAK